MNTHAKTTATNTNAFPACCKNCTERCGLNCTSPVLVNGPLPLVEAAQFLDRPRTARYRRPGGRITVKVIGHYCEGKAFASERFQWERLDWRRPNPVEKGTGIDPLYL